MELDVFIKERRPRWERLGQLLDQAERVAGESFPPREIQELVQLYRTACSDLNHARALTADPMLLGRLDQLTGRGYRYVYRDTRRLTLREQLVRLFLEEVPAAFQRQAGSVARAAAAMLLGAVFGAGAVLSNPHLARDLVPGMFRTDSPKERVLKIEKGKERIDSAAAASQFSAQLFTHNIQVSFLAFSLGALTIIGGYWLLFYNGIILGAIAAEYWKDGVTTFFIAWVGPHGALELPSIVFAGAAGVCMGRAILLPGNLSRASSLRAAMPDIRRMMLATAALLVVAGLVEGSFSQFSSKTFSYPFKISVAAALFLLMVCYLFLFGGRRRARGAAG
jgi:uncharacterized membrane protein SpoIIM required for sporulation